MKQPRVPEYRESEGVKAYIKPLILFLKDFTMAAWTANNQRKKEIEEIQLIPGATGPQGPQGPKPERGVDYWTPEDQAQIVSDVMSALPNADGEEF